MPRNTTFYLPDGVNDPAATGGTWEPSGS